MQRIALVLLLILAAGCKRNPEENAVSDPAPPPAAALARRTTLDEGLKELEKELSGALGAGLDDEGTQRLLRAEAITDRLLETEMPFSWLKNAYSLDSYVRQIQALADRLIAQMRSGANRDVLIAETTELRRKVISVRQALALGGGKPPLPLDSLLAAHPADSTIITGEAGE